MKTSELFNLNDKVALVTGDAAGIGKACALMLGITVPVFVLPIIIWKQQRKR